MITPDVGGGFGAKIGADPEFALVGGWRSGLGRPVRWSETRSENMTGMLHGRAQRQTVTIGGTRDGRVLAYRLDVLPTRAPTPGSARSCPPHPVDGARVYDIPRVESRARVVATTTTSIGAYRGAGRPEATAAIERAMDLFAAEIGMDPAEVRRRNLIPPDAFPFTTKGGVDLRQRRVREGPRPGARRRGLRGAAGRAGRAAASAATPSSSASASRRSSRSPAGGAFAEDATVEVHPDGTVTVLTGTSPHGQGHATAWAMLASEQLGIPVEMITVKHGDTDLVPRGAGTMGSRSLQPGGVAVHQAAVELVELARRRAADVLEAAVDDLEVADGAVRVRGTDVSVPLGRLAESEPLRTEARFDSGAPSFPFGAHLAVVEVDVETGKAVVVRIVTVDDAGPVLNPLLAEGQRHGGIAQGIAQALFEEVVFDADGNPLTASFADYGFPSAAELPSFELARHGDPDAPEPAGGQGHRRGRHHRRDPGRAERRRRRRGAPRRAAHRHARHTAAGVGGHPGRQGERGELVKVHITVNGVPADADVEPRLLLVHYLRDVLGLTATNVGCDTTSCGACTVLLDGESVKSCTVLAVQADGTEVTTMEGLSPSPDELHPVAAAFRQEHGLQCGFCTPGMVMAAVGLLHEHPRPTEREVREGLEGNLCRCTGYHNIVRAVLRASGQDPDAADEAAPDLVAPGFSTGSGA